LLTTPSIFLKELQLTNLVGLKYEDESILIDSIVENNTILSLRLSNLDLSSG
jgi:hypothetical protein